MGRTLMRIVLRLSVPVVGEEYPALPKSSSGSDGLAGIEKSYPDILSAKGQRWPGCTDIHCTTNLQLQFHRCQTNRFRAGRFGIATAPPPIEVQQVESSLEGIAQ